MMSIAPPAPLRAMFVARVVQRVRVVVDGDDIPGAELPRRERQHARSGADVDDPRAAQLELLQQAQAEPRRRVMPGAEARGGLDDDRPADPPFGRRRNAWPGTSHGGAMTRPPTVIAFRFSCERRAQSSSGTSIAEVAERGQATSERQMRGGRVALLERERKNTRQTSPASSSWMAVGTEVVEQRVEAVAKNASGRALAGTGSRAPDTQPKMSFTFSKNGLSPIVALRRLERLLRHGLRQLLEQVLLFLGQLLRDRRRGRSRRDRRGRGPTRSACPCRAA